MGLARDTIFSIADSARALSVLLFLLGGWWLDGKVGTAPLFMILGAFVGGGAGFYSLYRHIVIDPREREKDVEP